MATNVRQHYVARSYLAPFTIDGTLLHALDVPTTKCLTVSTRDVACEKLFYDISSSLFVETLSTCTRDEIDRTFNRFYENVYCEARNVLVNKVLPFVDFRITGSSSGVHVSRQMVDFLLIQYFRTSSFRQKRFGVNLNFHLTIEGHRAIVSDDVNIGEIHTAYVLCALYCCKLLERLDDKTIQSFSQYINEIDRIRNEIYKFYRVYLVIDKNSRNTFCTSDNPVVVNENDMDIKFMVMPIILEYLFCWLILSILRIFLDFQVKFT